MCKWVHLLACVGCVPKRCVHAFVCVPVCEHVLHVEARRCRPASPTTLRQGLFQHWSSLIGLG